jgi:hypothetical protein
MALLRLALLLLSLGAAGAIPATSDTTTSQAPPNPPPSPSPPPPSPFPPAPSNAFVCSIANQAGALRNGNFALRPTIPINKNFSTVRRPPGACCSPSDEPLRCADLA